MGSTETDILREVSRSIARIRERLAHSLGKSKSAFDKSDAAADSAAAAPVYLPLQQCPIGTEELDPQALADLGLSMDRLLPVGQTTKIIPITRDGRWCVSEKDLRAFFPDAPAGASVTVAGLIDYFTKSITRDFAELSRQNPGLAREIIQRHAKKPTVPKAAPPAPRAQSAPSSLGSIELSTYVPPPYVPPPYVPEKGNVALTDDPFTDKRNTDDWTNKLDKAECSEIMAKRWRSLLLDIIQTQTPEQNFVFLVDLMPFVIRMSWLREREGLGKLAGGATDLTGYESNTMNDIMNQMYPSSNLDLLSDYVGYDVPLDKLASPNMHDSVVAMLTAPFLKVSKLTLETVTADLLEPVFMEQFDALSWALEEAYGKRMRAIENPKELAKNLISDFKNIQLFMRKLPDLTRVVFIDFLRIWPFFIRMLWLKSQKIRGGALSVRSSGDSDTEWAVLDGLAQSYGGKEALAAYMGVPQGYHTVETYWSLLPRDFESMFTKLRATSFEKLIGSGELNTILEALIAYLQREAEARE